MKIKYFSILFIFSILQISYAQNKEASSILYLLPLQINAEEKDFTDYNSEYDIYADPQFQMLDFWKGAQIALQEYENQDAQLNIIVRDVYMDKHKIQSIFSDTQLMQDVKLIIGPFFASDFAEAAQYAKQLKIPIVNPFSSRTDFLDNNNFVYKVKPSQNAIPQAIHQYFLTDDDYNLILWYDENYLSKEGQNYIDYFTQNNIPFQKITTSTNFTTFCQKFSSNHKDIVIALFDEESLVLNQMRLFSNYINPAAEDANFIPTVDSNIVLIFPYKWLSHPLLDIDFYKLNNLYFFTDAFVDNEDENTLNFQLKYTQQFSSYPNIETFAYQGYDITKYFIGAVLGKFIHSKNAQKFLTVSRYSFSKTKNGGYENDAVRLIHIQDIKYQEIKKE